MRHLAVFFSAILLCLSQGLCAERRTWTDNTGRHKVIAEFVDLQDGMVRLKKKKGNIISVPIQRLSEKDQWWIASSDKALVGDVPQRLWPLRNKLLSAKENIDSAIANTRKRHREERNTATRPVQVAPATARFNCVQNTIRKMQRAGATRIEAEFLVEISYLRKAKRCAFETRTAKYSLDVGGKKVTELVTAGETITSIDGETVTRTLYDPVTPKYVGDRIRAEKITIVVTPETVKKVLAEARAALQQARKGPPALLKRQEDELADYRVVASLLTEGKSGFLRARQVVGAAADDPVSLEAELAKCEEAINSCVDGVRAELQRIREKHSRIKKPPQGEAKKPGQGWGKRRN